MAAYSQNIIQKLLFYDGPAAMNESLKAYKCVQNKVTIDE